MSIRTVYLVSDHTGITAEMLGKSLLSQFPGLEFTHITLPFIDTAEKARRLASEIAHAAERDGVSPLVFSTLADPNLRQILFESGAACLDLFDMGIAMLERALDTPATPGLGLAHGMGNGNSYNQRIEAVNFALNYDDGTRTAQLDTAEIILVGVSRSGKTPTCLYLAMQYGVQAANFPLTPEDFVAACLPASLRAYRPKLFGLTIQPERLHRIRQERRPDSPYAALENCRHEIGHAEALFRQEHIPFLDVSSMSVEEIAASIVHQANLKRRE